MLTHSFKKKSESKLPQTFQGESKTDRLLFQCSRLDGKPSYPIELIVHKNLTCVLNSYEHLSLNEGDFNRREISPDELDGQLLEIDAIKCDPHTSAQKIMERIKSHLENFQIHFQDQSLDYIQSVTWPQKEVSLRCSYSKETQLLSFFSPSNQKFKLIKNS